MGSRFLRPSVCWPGSVGNPSLSASSALTPLDAQELLRAGKILARLRAKIDSMLDEAEDCAKVLTSEGESVNDSENPFGPWQKASGTSK